MNKDEALRLALEAFNNLAAWNDGEVGSHMDEPYAAEVAREAITAIKAALEANEFNPDWDTQAVLTEEIQRMAKRIEELEAKGEPEYYGLTKDHMWMSISKEHYDRLKPEFRMACYTTPPQRTWVGLTDDERQDIALEVPIDAVLITEAKLRSKNT